MDILQATFDPRNSFYGKAEVEKIKNVLRLYSYDVLVCEIKAGKLIYLDRRHSQTTNRHIKEFLLQNKIHV